MIVLCVWVLSVFLCFFNPSWEEPARPVASSEWEENIGWGDAHLVLPVLGRPRQKDQVFRASLDIMRLKTSKKTTEPSNTLFYIPFVESHVACETLVFHVAMAGKEVAYVVFWLR